MKVLVTGGNGYIGRYVVRELLNMGCTVIVAAENYEGIDKRVIPAPIPIFSSDGDIYQKLGKPEVCIHLAWKDGFVHNSKSHMENLSSHIRFCNDMIAGGLPILSCMGTMHEVGYWEGAIDENTPCNPTTQYGIAKNALRQSLLLSTAESKCVFHWLRAFYIICDDIEGNSIFAKLLQAESDGKISFPFTSGKNKYDFLEIHKLAKYIVKASLQRKVCGITNICSGNPESLSECVERFIRKHHLNIRLAYGEYPDRPYDSPAIWGESKKIKEILNAIENQ